MRSQTARSRKNKPGFTLIETVVVLAIACILIALPAFCLTKVRARANMRQAMVMVSSQLEYDKRYALVSGDTVEVSYDEKNHVLRSWFCADKKKSSVQLPKDVQVRLSGNNWLQIEPYSCPAQTIRFTRGGEQSEMRMQLEWGKMVF